MGSTEDFAESKLAKDDEFAYRLAASARLSRTPSYTHCFSNRYADYPPIEDHALIGNMHTCALVSEEACIDWYCYPDFDSPALFHSILDKDKGGFFKISVGTPMSSSISGQVAEVRNKQMYVPDTNVLITRFLAKTGVAQVTDFMPVKNAGVTMLEHGWLIRELEVVRGRMYFRVECCPKFNWGRDEHETNIVSHGARFKSKDRWMVLTSTRPWNWTKHPQHPDGIIAEFTLCEGDKEVFVFRESYEGREDNPYKNETRLDTTGHPVSLEETLSLREKTLAFWRNWINKCTYRGRWREMVNRSALVLKLLTYEPTGAIIAAPTTSLPEGIGGHRQWDYRFTWIRDSSFTLYAFMKLGFKDEGIAFIDWIEKRCEETAKENGILQIMYGIRGEKHLEEQILSHLSGYMNSAPVRVGNGAFDQLQLDVYGELMDTIYIADKTIHPMTYSLWKHCRHLVNWVCNNWTLKDEGIWEVRGGRQHFVYSKMMCWVAIDRGIRLSEKRSLPCDIELWRKNRDLIYEEIHQKGWNSELQAFTQAYDKDNLDASVLMMPLVLFQSPLDSRMVSTVEAIHRSVENGGLMSNSLVYRYDVWKTDDGLVGEEGTFSICTFWLVEVLARMGYYDKKYLESARWIMEQMLGYANHVGLYSEEIGHSGEALGNFPQAFTHLALISAAICVDKGLDMHPN